MSNPRGNQSGAMTRRPMRPCDYIAYHDQQKVEAMQKRMEATAAQGLAFNQKQAANARKRSAMEAQMSEEVPSVRRLRQQQQPQYPQHVAQQLDPMIADTKKYLELKRRKQAFEDFLLTKRLQKEKAKSDRKMSALQKEFNQHTQKQQETKEMMADVIKTQQENEKKAETAAAVVALSQQPLA